VTRVPPACAFKTPGGTSTCSLLAGRRRIVVALGSVIGVIAVLVATVVALTALAYFLA
jgi:hypothetical protein